MTHIPRRHFTSEYYDVEYFAGINGGKAFSQPNGTLQHWSYFNPSGLWEGCKPIADAWKRIFRDAGNLLDVGCGRGPFIVASRDVGIEAEGFDFSEWAVGQGRVEGCRSEWLKLHDATKPWPYPPRSFDLVVALDFLEHIYLEDLDFVASEIHRVARRWIFLQIAIVGGGSGYGRHEKGYILKRGEPIPIGLEGSAVAGHVTVQPASFWFEKLDWEDVVPRRDLVAWFYTLVPPEVVVNWKKNLVMVLEVFE